MKTIDNEREDTLSKTQQSYNILESAKQFVEGQENELAQESEELNA